MGVIAGARPGWGRGGGRGEMGKLPAGVFEGGRGCTGTGIGVTMTGLLLTIAGAWFQPLSTRERLEG
ncbi:hypothetical protein GCM10023084_07290 [Streptomyces lacrimifluminis]